MDMILKLEGPLDEIEAAVDLLSTVVERIIENPRNRLKDAERRALGLASDIMSDRSAAIRAALTAVMHAALDGEYDPSPVGPALGANDAKLRELAAEWHTLEERSRAKSDAVPSAGPAAAADVELVAQNAIERTMAAMASDTIAGIAAKISIATFGDDYRGPVGDVHRSAIADIRRLAVASEAATEERAR